MRLRCAASRGVVRDEYLMALEFRSVARAQVTAEEAGRSCVVGGDDPKEAPGVVVVV